MDRWRKKKSDKEIDGNSKLKTNISSCGYTIVVVVHIAVLVVVVILVYLL